MDLRTAPRVPVQCPAVFSGDHLVGEGMVVNLSVPGCAINTTKTLREGDYLELRMLIPDQATPLAIDLARFGGNTTASSDCNLFACARPTNIASLPS